MSRMVRARYTLEYKQAAVRLVRGGQPIGTVVRGLGTSDQTVHNWVKAEAEGRLAATTIKPFTAEQAEIGRLKAELSRVRMERDILEPDDFWWNHQKSESGDQTKSESGMPSQSEGIPL